MKNISKAIILLSGAILLTACVEDGLNTDGYYSGSGDNTTYQSVTSGYNSDYQPQHHRNRQVNQGYSSSNSGYSSSQTPVSNGYSSSGSSGGGYNSSTVAAPANSGYSSSGSNVGSGYQSSASSSQSSGYQASTSPAQPAVAQAQPQPQPAAPATGGYSSEPAANAPAVVTESKPVAMQTLSSAAPAMETVKPVELKAPEGNSEPAKDNKPADVQSSSEVKTPSADTSGYSSAQ